MIYEQQEDARGALPQCDDSCQQRVITASDGEYLVLAPPGCGKTHLLMERVRYAHEQGVAYDDMLCLTFTNRAAYSMTERIEQHLADKDIASVYVGNVHRYCTHFLLDNALVPDNVSVLDDDDIISIMAPFYEHSEEVVATINTLRRQCFDAVHLAAMMFQIEHLHPKQLRLHPECLTKEDLLSLRRICATQQMMLTPATLTAIFHAADDYEKIIKSGDYPTTAQPALAAFVQKMRAAHYYHKYKREHSLLDFEDLLLLTYEALTHEETLVATEQHAPFKHYTWCQVDEVQDLNPLQLRIIDLLMVSSSATPHTMMFLGDEQQAIFSFMGARSSSLDELRCRCEGHIFHLTTNHRAPRYLLDVYNTYAAEVLHISPDVLPTAVEEGQKADDALQLLYSETKEEEYGDVAQVAQRLAAQHPDETIAIIVLTNADADAISECMDEMGIQHFKVSGTDMFACEEVHTLLATFSVIANEHNFLAWTHLLKGYHICDDAAATRSFVRQLFARALRPTDLFLPSQSSYVAQYVKAYEEEEIVVFDTETTGTDIFHDDIVEIAAVKIRHGEIVPGSEFTISLATNKELPAVVGGVPNPLLIARDTEELYSPAVALALFLDYVGGDILLGHNIAFDYAILHEQVRRHLPVALPLCVAHTTYDTLALCRRLYPTQHSYTLAALLRAFSLTGCNSHRASNDTYATVSLAQHLYTTAVGMLPAQRALLATPSIQQRARQIQRVVAPLYCTTRQRLATRHALCTLPRLADEIAALQHSLVQHDIMRPTAAIDHLCRYVAQHIDGTLRTPQLLIALPSLLLRLTTLRQTDLLGDTDTAQIVITTVHKAKGSEFDNVIIFDVNDDRYPAFYNRNNNDAIEEDKRKLYVAMTRARRRLLFCAAHTTRNRYGSWRRALSPFLLPVVRYTLPASTQQGQ